jgi:hypothetical protein
MPQLDLVHLEPGARVRLKDEAMAEVTTNPRDGMWLFGRFVESPADPARVGSEDLICLYDIVEIVG